MKLRGIRNKIKNKDENKVRRRHLYKTISKDDMRMYVSDDYYLQYSTYIEYIKRAKNGQNVKTQQTIMLKLQLNNTLIRIREYS